MILKLLVPELAYANQRESRLRVTTMAMRLFGFTFLRGLVLGGVMLIPSLILTGELFFFRFRRFAFSLLVFPLVCLCVQFFWMLVARRSVQRRVRIALCEMGEAICWACGYNLRGNVSGICPECGEPAYPASTDHGDGSDCGGCRD